jgi:hypothetical protein
METLIVSFVASLVGAYLGAYLKKKGENLATHEDIDKLVSQVAAVTSTTKEIEARISKEVWDRQKHWEMKREVLFEAAKRMEEMDDGLISLDSLLRMQDPDGTQWVEARYKATIGWREATRRFDQTKILVNLICSREMALTFSELGIYMSKVAKKLVEKDGNVYAASTQELGKLFLRTEFAIRKELGIEEPVSIPVSAGV